MAKLDYPYLHTVKARGRRYYWYRRDGQRIKLPKDPYSFEFDQAYRRIHESFKDSPEHYIRPGTVESVITEYKQSSSFTQRAEETRRGYRMHLDAIQVEFGKDLIVNITRKVVLIYRESLSEKPATANYRLAVLRLLLEFAKDRGYITVNHALKPKKFKTGTHSAWTIDQLEAFDVSVETGLAAAFFLAIYTGQREGDIIRFDWNKVHGSKIQVRQQKTGKPLLIPMHSRLKSFLDRLKARQTVSLAEFKLKGGKPDKASKMYQTIVTRGDGMSYGIDNFRRRFKEQTDALEIKNVVFHGLRKNSTHFLLHAGCTEHEVSSITGMSPQMVRHYAAEIDQANLAEKAMAKLESSLRL